jgi:hypothetical protein
MVLADRILTRVAQIPGMRSLWTRFPVGSVETRVRFGIWKRPHYAYGVYAAADLARRLHIPEISVAEFGVAGGQGLLALENIAQQVGSALGIDISVLGFDTGEGMPDPIDYRDLPHVWGKGFYTMDQEKLRAQLVRARLVLGDVGETVPSILAEARLPPLGFIAFDLDYYSSTKKAFRIFESEHRMYLPRVYCYFDDIVWPETACHNDYVGELCAIREFNLEHPRQKLCPIHMLRRIRPIPAAWNEQIYILHHFQHPLYGVNVTPEGEQYTQIPLE